MHNFTKIPQSVSKGDCCYCFVINSIKKKMLMFAPRHVLLCTAVLEI